jgi:hypothetical protein
VRKGLPHLSQLYSRIASLESDSLISDVGDFSFCFVVRGFTLSSSEFFVLEGEFFPIILL